MPVAVLVMSLGSQECLTTCTISSPGNVVEDDVAHLATLWKDGLAKYLSNQLSLVSIRYDGDEYPQSYVGGANSEPESSATALMIRKLNSGRDGRFFMPGVISANVDPDGRISSGGKAAINAALATAWTAFNASGTNMFVEPGSGGLLRSVTGLTCAPVIGLQGRRRFGH